MGRHVIDVRKSARIFMSNTSLNRLTCLKSETPAQNDIFCEKT